MCAVSKAVNARQHAGALTYISIPRPLRCMSSRASAPWRRGWGNAPFPLVEE